jgi:C4-dicarboxylate-specific signal transduction histidine kinase
MSDGKSEGRSGVRAQESPALNTALSAPPPPRPQLQSTPHSGPHSLGPSSVVVGSRKSEVPPIPMEPEAHRKWLVEELERTRARLLQADRLATLGTIAAGVGHELNNVAAVLNHTATFVRMRADQGKPPEPDDLVALERGVAHLTEHARNLLHLGTPGQDRHEVLDVSTVIADVLSMLHVSGRTKRVSIMTHAPKSPVRVAMSRTKLEQIFVNLVTNAADAVLEQPPEGRLIRIEVSDDRELGRAHCLVEDAGTGMAPEILARVFENYFTTKPSGKGTGLGLSVVKTLIEAVGGYIEIESELGKGTAVRFDLPLST